MRRYKIYTTSERAWAGMYDALLHAKHSIYWEVYIFVDDIAGQPFFDLLQKKAETGVKVKLIVDYFGSISLSRERIKTLQHSGVDIRFFSDTQTGTWKRMYRRTHRKILIVDQTIGFIGGVNIQNSMRHWLDIHVRLHGAIISTLSRSFAKSYITSGGNKSEVAHLLRAKKFRALRNVKLIFSKPYNVFTNTRTTYIEAIQSAKQRVVLFAPYFYPDRVFIQAIIDARKRNVVIDILAPVSTDILLITYANRACLALLRRAGAHIFLTKEMMHGKGMLVDGMMAIVGSSNFDQTSFYDNFEADVQLRDRATVDALQKVIHGWIRQSKDVSTHQKRNVLHRALEQAAFYVLQLWHRRNNSDISRIK